MQQIYNTRVRAGSTNSGSKCGSNMYTEAFFGDSDVGGKIIMLATFFVMLVIFSMY